jgi:hypothetical protein|tara:strand:+ start:432 stop:1100 length:669 start_codon:yes stop_codon:yes gene_type:complete
MRIIKTKGDFLVAMGEDKAMPASVMSTGGYGNLGFECGCEEMHGVNSYDVEQIASFRPVKILFKCNSHYTKVRIKGIFRQTCISEWTCKKSIAERKAKSEKKVKISKTEIKKKYKIIAKFYNNYKIIDYSNIGQKKIAQKQMEDIVNVVDKNLSEVSAGTENTPYRILVVGMITFKLISKEQVIKVHNDLRKLYKKGKLLEFDNRLMTALKKILDDDVGFNY